MFTPPNDETLMAPAGTPHRDAAGRCEEWFERRFQADPLAVRDALRAAVARFARRMSPEDAGALELTLAEVLNNVVEHAYADAGEGPVELAVCQTGGRLLCRVVDHGRPMPRLSVMHRPMPPTEVAPFELSEGGWGWALVRALTEGLSYDRQDDRNRLTFEIPLGCSRISAPGPGAHP